MSPYENHFIMLCLKGRKESFEEHCIPHNLVEYSLTYSLLIHYKAIYVAQ